MPSSLTVTTSEGNLFRDTSGAWSRLVRVIETPGSPVALMHSQSGSDRGELFFQRVSELRAVEPDPTDDRATRVCGASAAVLRGRRRLAPDELFLFHPLVSETRGVRIPSFGHLARRLARNLLAGGASTAATAPSSAGTGGLARQSRP